MKSLSRNLRIMIGLLALILIVALAYRFVVHHAAPVKAAADAPQAQRKDGLLIYPADAPQLSALKIVPVTESALPAALPMNGRVTYDENSTARVSSPILGRVTALRAEVGDTVNRNAPLVEIDSPDMASAEADNAKAEADENVKRLAFERARKLLDGGVIARKDYESAEADLRQASAETQRARLKLHNLNAAGSVAHVGGVYTLRAPVAGMVADKQVNPGLEVRPDLPNPLFTITDAKHLWVMVDASETSLGAIHPGQAVEVDVDAYPGVHFPGKVERVGLALDPNTRRVQVRCTVANPELKLKPEMFARVAFVAEGGARAIQVPNGSLVTQGLHSYLFVERQPGQFERRRVDVALSGPEYSYIVSGLKDGERLVSEGALLLNAEFAPDGQ